MKILIAGFAGYYNRGDAAVLLTTISLLRGRFPNAEIVVSSFCGQRDIELTYMPGIEIIPAYQKMKRWSRPWFIRQIKRIFSSDYRKNQYRDAFLPLIPYVAKADIVLVLGCDSYTMDYGYPDYFLDLNRLVKDLGKELIIWGASVGPFPRNVQEHISGNLKIVDLIIAREPLTVAYLKSIGVAANVKLGADSAFLLPASGEGVEIDLEEKGEILGVNVSPILSRYSKGQTEKTIIRHLVEFLRYVTQHYGLSVLLIPHVTRWDYNNDYRFMLPILESLKGSCRIDIVPEKYNAFQMKYIISKCRFFIGARTHSTIAALSSLVPTISIGYSLKSRGINEDIFGSSTYVIDIDELSFEYLKTKFNRQFQEESSIRDILRNRIPQIQSRARLNLDYFSELLHEKIN